MTFGWHGQKVALVPLERDRHFNNCVRWLNNPVVTQWLISGDFPLTRIAEEAFFDRVASGDNQREIVFAIETLQEEHVGIGGFKNISYRHGFGEIGLTIGRPQLWGRGYGSDAVGVLTRYAFDVLGLRTVLAEIMPENGLSVRVFEKNNYERVGCLPQRWWKRGAYRDSLQYVARRGGDSA